MAAYCRLVFLDARIEVVDHFKYYSSLLKNTHRHTDTHTHTYTTHISLDTVIFDINVFLSWLCAVSDDPC